MFKVKKPVKAATKGQKQIYEDNNTTIKRCLLGSSASLLVNIVLSIVIWPDSLTFSYYILTIFSLLIYVPCLFCLKKIATAKFNEKGAVIDAGADLNAGSGFAEWILNLIILTGLCQVFALFWIYLWVGWLLGPCYAFYVFWVNVAYPWICAPAPEEETTERDEKKERKLMRKQQRAMRG